MTARIWTDYVLRNVFLLLKDGYDYGEIAEMYGVSRRAVAAVVNRTEVGAKFRAGRGGKKAPARRFWTKTRRDELAAMYRREMPRKEIAKALNCTIEAVRHMADEMGLADRQRGTRIMAAQRKGSRHSEEALQKMREKARARWRRPEYVAKQRAHHDRVSRSELAKKGNDTRRGFSVPEDKKEAYDALMRKAFSSKEAGMLVGILPQGSVEIRDVRYKNRTKDEDYRRAKPITIVRDIAAEMQIPADAILSDRLEQPIVIARHRAVYEVARLRPDISITKIGQAFGRDHSTISNSLKVWPGIAAEYGYEAKPLTGRRATA